MAEQDKGLTSRIGRFEIDWPQSPGYYAGIALATALGMIEPPTRCHFYRRCSILQTIE